MNQENDILRAGLDMLNRVGTVLQTEGQVFLVGGSVRDLLLGKVPKDYDFTTPLLPDDIEARVRQAGKRPYLIGKRYGTVGFKLDGQFIEVTTFRTEAYTLGSRKPIVAFVDKLEEDLARRDFTFNAMALGTKGVIDPFGGQADLEGGIIRAVGSPRQRLREDPLRILRMIRFISRLGFAVEEDLAKKATESARRLHAISHERISSEMDGIITGPHAAEALRQMSELGILPYAVPLLGAQPGYDQDSPYHTLDLWNHTLRTLEGVEPDIVLRWAALLHDIGKPFARVRKVGRSIYVGHDLIGERLVHMVAYDLRWSKERTEAVAALVGAHMSEDSPLRPADNAAK